MRRFIFSLFRRPCRPKADIRQARIDNIWRKVAARQDRIYNIWHKVLVMEALRQHAKMLESGELDD